MPKTTQSEQVGDYAFKHYGYVYYPYRNISVYVDERNLTLHFPHMDRDKVDLNSFECTLRVRLGLNEEVVLHLAWLQDPCLPFSLVHNEHFLKFWDEVVPDEKEFISLTLFGDGSLNIDDTPKKINKTKPKKPVSLEPVRRSPRFQVEKLVENSYQKRGPARKLSFTDLLNEIEVNSCSIVEDGVKDADNEDNVHLFNTELDDDEDNDITYEEHMKTYKVSSQSEDSKNFSDVN
ncbi:hypothetical protein MKX01_029765 [Papaver californicum]|nr:hypothetical protein MKX01_029765 [Papaver californicum]